MMDILGVDIDGTFTDFVLLRDGRLTIHQAAQYPKNPHSLQCGKKGFEGAAPSVSPSHIVK
jgi:hypothetical protein